MGQVEGPNRAPPHTHPCPAGVDPSCGYGSFAHRDPAVVSSRAIFPEVWCLDEALHVRRLSDSDFSIRAQGKFVELALRVQRFEVLGLSQLWKKVF